MLIHALCRSFAELRAGLELLIQLGDHSGGGRERGRRRHQLLGAATQLHARLGLEPAVFMHDFSAQHGLGARV